MSPWQPWQKWEHGGAMVECGKKTHKHTPETTRDHQWTKDVFPLLLLKMVFAVLLTHVINIYTIKETGASCHVEMISQGLYSTYRVLSQKPKDKMLNCKKTTKKNIKICGNLLEKKPLLWEHWVSFTKHAYAHLYELGRKFLWEDRMCV